MFNLLDFCNAAGINFLFRISYTYQTYLSNMLVQSQTEIGNHTDFVDGTVLKKIIDKHYFIDNITFRLKDCFFKDLPRLSIYSAVFFEIESNFLKYMILRSIEGLVLKTIDN